MRLVMRIQYSVVEMLIQLPELRLQSQAGIMLMKFASHLVMDFHIQLMIITWMILSMTKLQMYSRQL